MSTTDRYKKTDAPLLYGQGMKDKLLELIEQKQIYGVDQHQPRKNELQFLDNDELVYHLLANGVIVPPCKVGQRVYVDENSFSPCASFYKHTFIRSKCFAIGEIVSITKTKKQLLMKIRISNDIQTRYFQKRYTVNAICKTVFLAREEAEKALAEREGNR